MNFGPITIAITIAIRPAMRTRTISHVSFASAGAMPSRPTERDALTSTASPGRTSVAQPGECGLRVAATSRAAP